VLIGDLSLPTLSVTSPIQVESGHLDIAADLRFAGLDSSISAVNGCITVGGVVKLDLTDDDLKRLQKGRTEYTLVSQDISCPNSLAGVRLQTSGTNGCKKLKSSASPNTSNARLSTLLEVDSSSCNTRWIILGSVLGGVILLFVIAVVIFTQCRPVTKAVAPFARTNM
jgi:hypothetical protein